MSKRKATEVLLSIEKIVKEIHGLQKNQDLLLKLLLSDKNKSSQIKTEQPKPLMPGIKPGVVLGNKPDEVVSDNEFVEEKIVEEIKHSGKRRTARYSDKPTVIQQQIVYADGKNVCLASVEIFDENKNLVKKTKTNATGKWTAALNPGQYIVNISKKPAANKPEIELSFNIDVPFSSTPIELNLHKCGDN